MPKGYDTAHDPSRQVTREQYIQAAQVRMAKDAANKTALDEMRARVNDPNNPLRPKPRRPFFHKDPDYEQDLRDEYRRPEYHEDV